MSAVFAGIRRRCTSHRLQPPPVWECCCPAGIATAALNGIRVGRQENGQGFYACFSLLFTEPASGFLRDQR
jgi:hypothetical protein